MVNVSILLLAVALVALAISVLILGKRVAALEEERVFQSSVFDLKTVNRFHPFFENRYPAFIAGDSLNPFDRTSADSYSDVVFSCGFPRPFAEDESSEL